MSFRPYRLSSGLEAEGRSTVHAKKKVIFKVLSNTSWLFLEKIVKAGVVLLLSSYLARYLGPGKIGSYYYTLALVGLFAPFACVGMDYVVIRKLVLNPDQEATILGTSFFIRLAGTLAAFALVNVLVMIAKPAEADVLFLTVLGSIGLFFRCFEVIDYLFQARLQSRLSVISRSLAFALLSLGTFGMIRAHAQLWVFVTFYSLEFAVCAVLLVVIYQKFHGKILGRWQYDRKLAREMLQASLPIMIQGVMITAYMRLDQIMLGQYSTAHELGIYGVAYRLVEGVFWIPTLVTTSLFPLLVEHASGEENRVPAHDRKIDAMFALMIWLAIPISLFTTFFSDRLIVLFFGESYRAGGPVLAILSWLVVNAFFGVTRTRWLVSQGDQTTNFYVQVPMVLISIILNRILIPHGGAQGAAIAAIGTVVGGNMLGAVFSKKIRYTLLLFARALVYPFSFRWGMVRGLSRHLPRSAPAP